MDFIQTLSRIPSTWRTSFFLKPILIWGWKSELMEWVHNEGILVHSGASQVAQWEKNLPANAGEARGLGSVPESGRSPGGGNGNPLRYSCLENSMDRGTWQAAGHAVTKSWTPWWARMHTVHSADHLLLPSPQYCGFCSTHPDEITLWTLPGILQFDFSVTFAIANQLENSSSVFTALFLLLAFRTFYIGLHRDAVLLKFNSISDTGCW